MKVLTALRKKRNLKQTDIARQTGLSAPAINILESGLTKNPRPETLLRLASVWGVQPSLLLKNLEDLTPAERKEIGL